MTFFVLLVLSWSDTIIYKIPVNPVQLQSENKEASFLTGIAAIDTDGQHIFISDKREPKVVQFKPDGTLVQKIGGKGNGPGELGYYGPQAFAVNGSSVWILSSRGKTANYYENGEFVTSFRTWHYIRHGSGLPSYRFDFNEDLILLPAFPLKNALARVYDYGGKGLKNAGKELPRQMEFLEVNPTLNNTMWQFDGTYWYALFFHRPILRKFTKEFALLKEFTITGPEIDLFEHKFFENKRDRNWTYPKPHFTDLFVFRNYVFAFSNGVLYQINGETGHTVSRTYFKGTGQWKDWEVEGRLFFHFLVFLENDQLYVANSSVFEEADVWIPERVPYFD